MRGDDLCEAIIVDLLLDVLLDALLGGDGRLGFGPIVAGSTRSGGKGNSPLRM